MAELEEAEPGRPRPRSRMAARAVRAPRDPAWTADGVVLEEWAPVSPVSGKLDAVEWKLPVAEIEGPRIEIDKAELAALPPARDDRAESNGGEQSERAPDPNMAVGPTVEVQPTAPDPRVVRMTKMGRGDPSRPLPLVDPPQPDDPGVVAAGDDSDERRSKAL